MLGLMEEARGVVVGGLFLDPAVPASFVACVSGGGAASASFPCRRRKGEKAGLRVLKGFKGCFLSVSFSIKGRDDEFDKGRLLGGSEEKRVEEVVVVVEEDKVSKKLDGAMNTTKHLWAGAVAAMVSRSALA